jgi:Bacterial extracellular solute-binding protein, family 7
MITTQLTRNTARVVVIAATIALLASCATPPGRSGAVDPVTLKAGWGSGPGGGVGEDVIGALLDANTDSAIEISGPTEFELPHQNDTEGDTITALQHGEVDIAAVRADRLVKAGAKSLAPLQAPLVVTNDEQAAKIAADGISADLMSSLGDLGLVGIALAPGGLRHPFGYKSALLGVDDYQGKVINTRPGSGADAIFTALGAKTDHSVGDERVAAAANGTLRGIDVFVEQLGAVDRPAVMTSNVVLYEKFDVIVVRAKVFDALTPPQREALLAQVKNAISSATKARYTEESGTSAWCALSGASVALATPDQLAEIKSKLEPVLANIRKDAAAKKAIVRMLSLHTGTTDPVARACGDPIAGTTEADFLVTPVGDQTVLDGVWRLEAKLEDFKSAGTSVKDANANAGVWTFTTKNGLATIDQPNGEQCKGEFAFDGDQISLNWSTPDNDHCYGHSKGTFTIEGKTAHIVWTSQRDYDVAQDNAMFKHGLVKVG